ncbi:MAG: DUF2793 domain-containing protein, partial [Rhizobiaceae bacterium]|nr:DUF2793 domain-containing protein [Rhizobiaceae bacterium]MCB2088526.1 DUF2793 domain-containing protein [Sphingomonadaceae bacterium]
MLHAAIEGESSAPPITPAEGECWLVSDTPTGSWTGHAGELAGWQAGTWLFVTARDGMRLLDRSTGQWILHNGAWQRATPPNSTSGGTVVDVEARNTLDNLISALRIAGIFPAT